jgi:hypothetical protein
VRDVPQLLLQRLRIDTLNRAVAPSRQLINFPHARVVAALRQTDRDYTLRMTRQHHTHGV